MTNKPKTQAETAEEANRLKKRKRIKFLGYALFIILNVIVLYFTAKADFSKEAPPINWGALLKNNVGYLFGAVACIAVVLLAETIKYLIMMRRLGERFSVGDAFETVVLGKYFDAVTPSGAGGQPFQIYNLHSKGYSSGTSSAMVLASFVTMQYGFVILALAVFIFNSAAISAGGIKAFAYIGIVTYSIVPTLIVISAVSERTSNGIVAFFIKIGAKLHIVKDPQKTIEKSKASLKSYSDSLKYIAKSKSALIEMFILSVLYHVALCSVPFFVIRFFGDDPGFIQSLCMCVFVYASVTIVPTPGNSGAAEGSFYILFNQLDTAGLFWAMLVWRFLCYYFFILLGVLVYGARTIRSFAKKRGKSN